MRKARRFVASFIPFILAVSTLSAISIVTAPSAQAATAGSGNCEQTFTATSGSGTVTVTEANGFCYVAFKNTGAVDTQATISWTRPTGLSAADVLVIGGGGGGGARHAGGGGAGGYVEATSYALTTSTVTVVVGAGGSGAAGGNAFRGSSGRTSAFYNPSNSAHGLTALGGGYGAYNEGAANGGSGGGSGSAVASTTTGTGVVTALGNNANATGGFATINGTATLTNKRIDPRTSTAAATATLTPDISAFDQYNLTAQDQALTVAAPTGTPVDGNKLILRILDNGTARAITWNATYTVIGTTLPTTTTINKMLYVGCIYNSTNTRWDVVAVTTQA
jgi:hypothetical protein